MSNIDNAILKLSDDDLELLHDTAIGPNVSAKIKKSHKQKTDGPMTGFICALIETLIIAEYSISEPETQTTTKKDGKNKMNDKTPKIITMKHDPVFGSQMVGINRPETLADTNDSFEQAQNISKNRNLHNAKRKGTRGK